MSANKDRQHPIWPEGSGLLSLGWGFRKVPAVVRGFSSAKSSCLFGSARGQCVKGNVSRQCFKVGSPLEQQNGCILSQASDLPIAYPEQERRCLLCHPLCLSSNCTMCNLAREVLCWVCVCATGGGPLTDLDDSGLIALAGGAVSPTNPCSCSSVEQGSGCQEAAAMATTPVSG